MVADLVQLEGFDAFDRDLNKLSGKVSRKVGRKAIRFAAAPVRKAARRLAPIEDGDLKRSMFVKVKIYKRTGTVVAIVGAKRKKLANGKNPANYAHLVEFGHVIRKKKGGPTFGRVQPKPFLRPAWDSTRRIALSKMAEKFRIEIAKEARKL